MLISIWKSVEIEMQSDIEVRLSYSCAAGDSTPGMHKRLAFEN